MRNRLGLKDLVIVLLVVALGGLTFLQMLQADRLWERVVAVESTLREVSAQLARRPAVQAPSAGTPSGGGPASRDTTWARPGVEIEWQQPWKFWSEPSETPGFVPGGEFTEIFSAQPARITPYLSTDVYGRRVIDQVVSALASLDAQTLEMRGVMADAWQVDPDGLWVRTHLRSDVVFSDGQPVTAEDVRWTLMDFVKNPLIEAERSRALLDQLSEVKVIDSRTVEFIFTEALFTNRDIMSSYVLPKHFYSQFTPEQINQSTGLLMGSGPFKLPRCDLATQWAPGSEDVVLVRNERYWEDPVALAGMRFKVVTNDLAALTSYTNGEGDMLTPTSPQFVEKSKSGEFEAGNYALEWINMRSGYSFIGWQCGPRRGQAGQLTPFHDKRVRTAMTMIMDRDRMIRDIWDGIGVVAVGPSEPSSPATNPSITPVPYDPVGADALLKQAGWTDANGDGVREYQLDDGVFAKGRPFEFELTMATGGQIVERIVGYVRDQCTRNGIRCTPRLVDWSFFSDMLKQRDFDALMMGWSANSPESDPRQIWHSSSIADQGDNFIQWKNADADILIEKGRRTINTAERMAIWQQFHAVVAEDQPYSFLRVSPWLRFINRSFGNVHTYRTGLEPQEFCSVQVTPAPVN